MGLSATGKTTLAKKMAESPPCGCSVILWTLDDHPNLGTLRDKNDTIFHQIKCALTQRPSEPTIHIIDDTMHLHSMRKRYVMLCRELKIGIALVHLSASIKELLSRNQRRLALHENAPSNDIILSMAEGFEPIRGSMAKFLVEPSKSMETFWSRIEEKFVESKGSLFQEEFTKLEDYSESLLHDFDIFIRRAIHNLVEISQAKRRPEVAKKLKLWKDEMMDGFKDRLLQGNSDQLLDAFRENSDIRALCIIQSRVLTDNNDDDFY